MSIQRSWSMPVVDETVDEMEIEKDETHDRFRVKTFSRSKSNIDEDEEEERMEEVDTKSVLGIPQTEQHRVSIFSHLINLTKPPPAKRNSIDLTIDDCLSGEVLPTMDNYRKSFNDKAKTRLSIDELLNECQVASSPQVVSSQDPDKTDDGEPVKLTWIEGVLMNCLLNIWGVMLFLRVTWVIGQAGLVEGLVIITLSNSVTFFTSLSMSAICTNGQITGGGLYYMISRSLGPEFGGAIGLMLTLANSMGVAMETIGFCESFLDMLVRYVADFSSIANAGRINDLRLLGVISLMLLLALAIGGMNWVTRVQVILLIALVAAQVDFVVGTMLTPDAEQQSKGFVGFSMENFEKNMWPDFSHDTLTNKMHSFFTVFAVFFPACSGIDAGANLSGDLKDPVTAIPKGTLLAIGITYVSYILTGVLSAGCSLRYASGIEAEYHFSQNFLNETTIDELNITQTFYNCTGRSCNYGLIPSQQMIEVMSGWGPLIYAGCFAATLSSAISCLVGAPRIFQAVAKDKLYPGLDFFAEGYGKNNEPLRGYCLVFIISVTCILIGDLNQVSSILSNFFVASFAMINFSVFHASITKAPNWRPTFRYYNPWLSLFATLLCLVVMFLMDYRTAIATYLVIILLYVIIYYRKPDANWGSSAQSLTFISALRGVQTLEKVEDHVKTYRPKILLFSGDPKERPFLIHLANLITKRLSLLQCINLVTEDMSWEAKNLNTVRTQRWLSDHRIKAFYSITKCDKFKEGARFAMELVGLGNLSPNLVMLGFKDKWKQSPQEARDYVSILQIALEQRLSLGILRVQGGLTTCSSDPFQDVNAQENKYYTVTSIDNFNFSIEGPTEEMDKQQVTMSRKPKLLEKVLRSNTTLSRDMLINPNVDNTVYDETILQNLSQFSQFKSKKVREGSIDVYWLYDTGGLTLLLPFIINSRAMFSKCKMRVFVLANKSMNLKEQAHSMALMLKKFRITFQQIILISDATKKPDKNTKDKFHNMLRIAPADCSPPGEGEEESVAMFVSAADLHKHRDKTNFYLRIAEIVQENSSQAAMIFMTLPLPTKGNVPPSLYMAWLDFVSQNLPPFLYVRGNQASVLTFYS